MTSKAKYLASPDREDEPMDRSAPWSLAGVRILVVEDDPASARMLALLLTSAGAEVRVACSAFAALEILAVYPARVLIVDLVLPHMSGLALARTIKDTSPTGDLIVIAVSVVDGPETERRALASGCSAYVHKPIDTDAFIQVVADLLRGQP
jgi:CheY-like chemotaxis protein